MNTNAQDREELRRDMAEAAALAADDPQRERVMRRVQEVGVWAENEWIELVEIDERLRLGLPRVSTPAGLQDRLLAIPAVSLTGSGLQQRDIVQAVAVGMTLMVVLVAGWLSLAEKPTEAQITENIAMLAASDHLRAPVFSVRSSDPSEVQTALARATTLPVRLPAFGPDYQIQGGRICRFDEHPVVYTRWQHQGRAHSLYQFQLEEFGLPQGSLDRNLSVALPSTSVPTQRVVMWSEGICGYALVCEEYGEDSIGDTKQQL